MTGTLYFIAFQILGIHSIKMLFQQESTGFCLLLGSTVGSFLLQWFPTLFAFFTGFTISAHILALISLLLIFCGIIFYKKQRNLPILTLGKQKSISLIQILTEHPCVLLIVGVYVYMILVLWQHTILPKDGAYMTGQCTYGDMNMHLGFITSIANQKIFPPEYSILPGAKLSYPFLSDSISSSVYLMGASLKWAYLLPMFTALLQVFFGMYLLTMYLLNDKRKSILAYILFFFNGGFGIYYFITKGFSDTNFTRIFTEFYQTPTNYVDKNIQWHNILVDMLIPQRATLFGWAVLFPLLYMLIKASREKKQYYFIPAGILAGGLPLIHTHSFLALGILCSVFLFLDIKDSAGKETKQLSISSRFIIVALLFSALYFISLKMLSKTPLSNNIIFAIGLAIILAYLIYLIYYFLKYFNKSVFIRWGTFLGIVLALALPQLIAFTFKQATGEEFTRGGFNWANSGDNYILFAIKNYGIMFFLMIGVFLYGNRKQLRIIKPACFLWLISEFIIFQPNIYDNNKILLVAYLFFCIAAADFVCEKVEKLFRSKDNARHKTAQIHINTWLKNGCIILIAFLSSISAILTMCREYVSEYELYSKAYVEAANYIEKHTKASDTILTATNHNNAIASLTGRNIVCGSSSFLYYHGIDYAQNEVDVRSMYEIPEDREQLFEKYNVKYIVLGPNETGAYTIPDFDNLVQVYPVVFSEKNVVILRISGN